MAQCLQKLIKLTTNIKYIREIHTTQELFSQRKVMKKLMSGGSKKKFKYSETPLMESPTSFTKAAFEGAKSRNSKRANVLNKLFMRHITDLMVSGESSSKFIGKGIEINRVKITPDYQLIQVFWMSKHQSSDDTLQELLNTCAGNLRHELTQLRLMGVVPKIKFVKDKQFLQLIEIDERLRIADCGDDFVPTNPNLYLQTELQLNLKLDNELKSKIINLEEQLDEFEESIPEMPQNVLGLNHAAILERVQKSMHTAKALHRNEPNNDEISEHKLNEDAVTLNSKEMQRQAFRDFLTQRQILKSKAKKAQNKSFEIDDLDELHLQYLQNMKNDTIDSLMNDIDYLDEEK